MSAQKKIIRLKKLLSKMGSVVIAYSGGCDSTFLLKIARDTIGKNVLAVTADSATYPRKELQQAKLVARLLGVRHRVIRTRELDNNNFLKNHRNRCYFCKKELFVALKKIAKENNINFVLEAGNFSDRNDFRPGNLAKEELGIRSPLDEVKLTKEEIRKLSKKLSLPTWNKPSLACLASRVPYGARINIKILGKINAAEDVIRGLGIKQVRIRHYNALARIEVLKKDIGRVIEKRSLIVDRLKRLGYNYVTLDLEGYRTGSLNQMKPKLIERKQR